MAKNQISDVRQALFDQLQRLQDPNLNLEKEIMRSNAIVDVTGQLIDSIKVEVDFIKVTGALGTGIIPTEKQIGSSKVKKLGNGSNS